MMFLKKISIAGSREAYQRQLKISILIISQCPCDTEGRWHGHYKRPAFSSATAKSTARAVNAM
jgi:hypothetical protein